MLSNEKEKKSTGLYLAYTEKNAISYHNAFFG